MVSRSEAKFWILSVALWRSAEPVQLLTLPQVRALLPLLHARLHEQTVAFAGHESIRNLATSLELLLALLRTRSSTDPAMKALLSPVSEHGRQFTEEIDRLTDLVVETGRHLPSRVDLHVDKPAEFSRIPDLLYALRLYLTGDDGALSVRITGVKDE